jgi:7,8-dihydropterin-6-yl-methyl-4-(beta-D-ribofuranosyl)aminobenzene 5'-phosphate synthase
MKTFAGMFFLILIGGMMAVYADAPTVTIVYDNETLMEELTPDWGFSCFIEGTEKRILFDAGGDGSILLSNMEKLKIEPQTIDAIVLSHIHGDHTGGLWELLKATKGVVVYAPSSFPDEFAKRVESMGGRYIAVEGAVEICEDVFLTGELGEAIKEQSLCIKTEKGLVVITGCAHPGIVHIVETAKKQFQAVPYMVFGGFHLLSHAPKDITQIVQKFRELGVEHAGPCHCSGESARVLFSEEYGDNYMRIGVGKVITIE